MDSVGRQLRTVTDQARCYLATQEQLVVSSVLRAFSEEFAEHLEGRCRVPHERRILMPKIVDLRNGVVTYDQKQALKEADWSYRDD